MTDTHIKCPNCDYEIPIFEALSAQIRGEFESSLKADHEARLKRAVAEAEQRARGTLDIERADLKVQIAERAKQAEEAAARELELRRKTRELEEEHKGQAERIRAEVEAALRKDEDERIKQAAAAAEARARDQSALTLKELQADLIAQREKTRLAQEAELALRKEKSALEERAQELQGEVLELDIQAALESQFPQDRIEPVLKGARGADIQQRVRNDRLEDCGLILWETKNAKNWAPAWVDKLKQDQRAAGAAAAVLVSVALPDGIEGFGRIDGIWVAGLKAWPALAVALREQLIQIAYARAASEGKNEKMELLYQYLSGNEFRQRAEAIVEAFTAMQTQIHRERRAMEKQWAEREKQIQRVVGGTTAMYGALQGIVGGGLAAIPALELDDANLLEDRSDD